MAGGRIRRIGRRLGGGNVEEAASCARALTAWLGRRPAGEILTGDPVSLSRSALTARVLGSQDRVPWPHPMMRQLDPDDPAFLPVVGMHPVLAGRERIRMGLPERTPVSHVDPWGWCAVNDGPSVAVWFGRDGVFWPVGRRPDEAGSRGFSVSQSRSDPGLRTVCERGGLRLELHHWPIVLDGRVAFAIEACLETDSDEPLDVALAFAIRPAGREGSAPIFHLTRDTAGLWRVDDQPFLALARTGDAVYTGTRATLDPWHALERGVPATDRPGKVDVRCPAGQCAAAEVSQTRLASGKHWSRLAIFAPPQSAPQALARTSARSLWAGARADRAGLLAAGATFQLADHGTLLASCLDRLLLEPVPGNLPACLGAVALARLGFVRRAGDRLSTWLGRVGRDGRVPRGEAEDGAVLAWAAAEYVRWTGERGWLHDHRAPWRRLLDRLVRDPAEPGGRPLFGPDGALAWTAIWRAVGLLDSASVLRELEDDHASWALAGGAQREALRTLLGEPPWTARPDRAPDGSSAGLLTAAWVGLLPPDHPGVQATAAHVRERWWHGGGVLHMRGTHVAATVLMAGVRARTDDEFDPLGLVAPLGSSVGALPTARHPTRGALGRGDDYLSAALFVLLALDRVQVGRGTIRVRPGVVEVKDLPTPYGRIDVHTAPDGSRSLVGRWRGLAPKVSID